MRVLPLIGALASAMSALALIACTPVARAPAAAEAPAFSASGADPVAVGRHIAMVGGCNDCHTDGYSASNGATPEADWLKGSPVGQYGPWGTTYASNLRLIAASMTEDQWVHALTTNEYRPPMPFYIVRKYNERDLRALYQYIRQLGEPGPAAPAALPPSPTPPSGPYYDYMHGGPPPTAPTAPAPPQP